MPMPSYETDVHQWQPCGKQLLVKDVDPDEVTHGKSGIIVPQEYKDKRDRMTTGVVLAAGSKTKLKKFGPEVVGYNVGDKVAFRGLYNWNDFEMVKKGTDGGRYMFIPEDDLEYVIQGD